jgi:hypothetical protein
MATKKRRRKPIRYKAVAFKLTAQQKKRVDAFCKKHNTTPIHMYKQAIMHYLTSNGFGAVRSHSEPEISANQMSIFDIVEDPVLALES